MTAPQSITSEIQKLEPSAVIELFVLDATNVGGPVLYFHAGTAGTYQPIVWQGQEYTPFPMQASGFDFNGRGQIPRPKLSVSNVNGTISALLLQFSDLVGAKVTRKRTLAKYLDAVNYPGGVNPTADATAQFGDDAFYIDRKSAETKDAVEFELAALFDLYGVQLPRRQIIQNTCVWQYRGPECGYTGSAYFTYGDTPTGDPSQDVCGKRLSSCKCRFGAGNELPYGSFPAAGMVQ